MVRGRPSKRKICVKKMGGDAAFDAFLLSCVDAGDTCEVIAARLSEISREEIAARTIRHWVRIAEASVSEAAA